MEQPCPVCGSHSTSEEVLRLEPGPVRDRLVAAVAGLGDRTELAIGVCRACQHGWRRDVAGFADNLEQQRDFFDHHVSMPARRPRWPHRMTLVAREIEQFVGTGGKVLDIGCGTGQFLAALGEGFERHGLDLSPVSADVARRFAGAEVFCGPLEDYRAPVRSFDVISAFGIIEHLHDPHVLVRWAHDHLRPGGLFLITTGDRVCDDARRDGDAWAYYWIPEHISYFSGQSLALIAERAGFRVRRREWRWLCLARPLSRRAQVVARAREILRRVTRPRHDQAYVYAVK